MGGGVSVELNQEILEDVINKVEKLPEGERLDGEQVETIVGMDFFDPNYYDTLSTLDDQTGLHLVNKKDLLKLLIAQQIVTDPNMEATTINEFEEQEELKRFRNEILSQNLSKNEICDMRGTVWPQSNEPLATYHPIRPADADSRTKVYPHASTGIFILQRREGGWNLGLFRNSKTGEWGIPTANFTQRHELSHSRNNQLRSCASESLYQFSCGLLKCSNDSLSHILRDDCSVSVSYDDGEELDQDGKQRHLMQLFVIRVEGMNSEDYQSNRSIIQRNLEGKIPKQAWLEMDDFTFVHTEKLQNISNSNFTVADINGRVCSCRRLINIISRNVVDNMPIHNPVLKELIMRFEYLLLKFNDSQNKKNKNKNVKYSYFEKRWFGRPDEENEGDERQITENVELKLHPNLEGGVLAGAYTAYLHSSASLLFKVH